MDFLLLIGLGAGFFWLRQRVLVLEERVSHLQTELSYRERRSEERPVSEAIPAQRIASEPAGRDPPPTTTSVPLTRREEAAPIQQTEPVRDPLENDMAVPAPEQEPLDEEPAAERGGRFQFDFEDIFGRRLPIWAGGITLAIAGVFLVRYSIESGLLTPAVRVAMAFLFGIGLLGGAEWAFRNPAKVADERIRQALAGAGLATLYAAFYLAGTQYGLIGQTFAFLGLAAVTAGAIALSFRFGLPCAILGLVGGFAAPVLVGGDEANLPLLSLYLGLVTAGLTVTGKSQARPWLSIAALVAGLGWGALLLLSGNPGLAEVLALGLYFVVLGAVLPAFAGAQSFERPLRLGSAFVASAQLALLVDQGGYAPLAWGLYLLLGATLAFLAWRKPELRETGAIAATVSAFLLAQWDGASGMIFASVTAALALVYAGVPLAHVWRKSHAPIDVYQLVAMPLALAAIAYATFGAVGEDLFEPQLALAAAGLAIFPLAGAWKLWADEPARHSSMLLASGAALVLAALLLVTPVWLAGVMASLVFGAVFYVSRVRMDGGALLVIWGAAIASLLAMLVPVEINDEMPRLFGLSSELDQLRAGIRWAAALIPWAVLALFEHRQAARRSAEVLAALLVYGLVAQFLPSEALTWFAALAAIALWFWQHERVAGQVTLLAVAGLWAIAPVAAWLLAGIAALMGDPFLMQEAPNLQDIALRLAPFAIALGAMRLPVPRGNIDLDFDTRWLALPVSFVIIHALFKHVFDIDTVSRFVDFGVAERTIWQALLLASAFALTRPLPRIGPQPWASGGLAILALSHALWFTGVLHNPLFDAQAVGPTPLANWVLVAGVIAVLSALLLRLQIEGIGRIAIDAAIMLVVSFAALGLLRQAFSGSLLIEVPMSQSEDLLRSLLGIVLALAFLFIGKWRAERSWRIGSLVIMLVAVAKVFLVDAAGLEGLLRIASFMALGFSLIGIGWIYARQLRAEPKRETVT
ncbi:DUF2339 domain-containing protein [Altererythrobacter sp. GH1-8]|uniref:DUF2339 domain-containing protein n=1 Tax=Altererythrobacter sp. GH1-8 TaxID=3349333 RepID=UPI00374DB51E